MTLGYKQHRSYALNTRGIPVLRGPASADGFLRSKNPGATEAEINTLVANHLAPQIEGQYPWAFVTDEIHSYIRRWNITLGEADPPDIVASHDHDIDLSGDWIVLPDDLTLPSTIPGTAFTRIPTTTGHTIADFTITLADRRPDLIEHHNRLHSADAHLEEQVQVLHESHTNLLSIIRNDLLSQKSLLREDSNDPDTEADLSRVRQAIHEVNMLDTAAVTVRNTNFIRVAAVKLTNALIAGHPLGEVLVHTSDYVRLGRKLADTLSGLHFADAQGKLTNMIANLESDHGRSGFDRLVPTDEARVNAVKPSVLSAIIQRPPPQFGSAPT